MEEVEYVNAVANNATDWFMILSMVMNFVFGGTTLFGLIKWRGERKLRYIDTKKEEKNLDVQNFDALVKQIEYQEELLAKYIENKRKSEELEDERDKLIIEMKRNQTNLELEKISLQKKLTIAETLYENVKDSICKKNECKERVQ